MDPFSYQPPNVNNNPNKANYAPANNLDDFFGDGISLTQYERQAEPQD